MLLLTCLSQPTFEPLIVEVFQKIKMLEKDIGINKKSSELRGELTTALYYYLKEYNATADIISIAKILLTLEDIETLSTLHWYNYNKLKISFTYGKEREDSKQGDISTGL